MIGFSLLTLCLLGFIFTTQKTLHIPRYCAPFFTLSLLGVTQYSFAITGFLYEGTLFTIVLGIALFIVITLFAAIKRQLILYFNLTTLIYVLMLLLAFWFSQNMFFRVSDEYVYWGIASKSLYMTGALPDSSTSIIAKHLAYTPGLAVYHYLVYQLFGEYSEPVAFFAQNTFLVSILILFFDPKHLKKSIFNIAVVFFLTGLFFGTVLAKLSVDYLLALYLTCILWLFYYTPNNLFKKLLTISAPLIFLTLIKQIGLYSAIIILMIIFLDLFITSIQGKRPIPQHCLYLIVAIIGSIALVQGSWFYYTQAQGFRTLMPPLTLSSLSQIFDWFGNQASRRGLRYFLWDFVFSGADRLNTAYIIWYSLLGILWFNIIKNALSNERTKYRALLITLVFFLFIYLIMLLIFQVTTFDIGNTYQHTIHFDRFYNVIFAGIALFTILKYIQIHERNLENIGNFVYIILFASILITSSVIKTQKSGDRDIKIRLLAHTITSMIDSEEKNTLCFLGGNDDAFIMEKLTYFLFPHKVVWEISQNREAIPGYCDKVFDIKDLV